MVEKQILEIWHWLGTKEPYTNGVTNQEALNKFGEEYKTAWRKTKNRYNGIENGLFYENGKWHRWNPNY